MPCPHSNNYAQCCVSLLCICMPSSLCLCFLFAFCPFLPSYVRFLLSCSSFCSLSRLSVRVVLVFFTRSLSRLSFPYLEDAEKRHRLRLLPCRSLDFVKGGGRVHLGLHHQPGGHQHRKRHAISPWRRHGETTAASQEKETRRTTKERKKKIKRKERQQGEQGGGQCRRPIGLQKLNGTYNFWWNALDLYLWVDPFPSSLPFLQPLGYRSDDFLLFILQMTQSSRPNMSLCVCVYARWRPILQRHVQEVHVD